MNSRAIDFIRNFSYTLTSNLISLFSSVLLVLIVPKIIGVQEYGYWQLYLFYTTYVGFLHFGWNDGIYLRYGGEKYKNLDKKLFFTQLYMLIAMQLIISIIISILAILLFKDENRIFIIRMTAVYSFIVNIRLMLTYILQATNRIKEYAQITMISKILSLMFITFLLLFGKGNFEFLIVLDLVGHFISLLYAFYCCRDFAFLKITNFYFSIKETVDNISVGIKLMFANIASLLIIGTVRFGIESEWDVETFGKVSLMLSLSNFMLLFINALGIIIFPVLRRTEGHKLPKIYLAMRDFLMIILLGALVIYYPLKAFMGLWLPDYSDSLIYMALLFPICVYEGKMALLINTYLKTLRKEKLMLKINLISLVVSILLTLIITVILKKLDLAVLLILFLLVFRCVLSEIYLSSILKVSVYKDIVLELVLTIHFILMSWFIKSWFAICLYISAYIIYIIVKRKDIGLTFNSLKKMIRK